MAFSLLGILKRAVCLAAPFFLCLPAAAQDESPPPAESAEQSAPQQERIVAPWDSFQPEFRQHLCPFRGRFDYDPARTTCGYVLVPENRTDADSRLIKIAVAVFRADTDQPAAGSTALLTGGPGGPAIDGFAPYVASHSRHKLFANSDMVLIDQRGIGYSQGRFCKAVRTDIYTGAPSGEEAEAATIANLRRCFEEARRQGIDIRAYSTWHNALDFRDVRRALDLESWNIYGISYGTELGQAILQVDAAGTRAAIFDSVVPASGIGWDLVSAGMRNAMRELDAACSQDATCRERFEGALSDKIEALIKLYTDRPVDLDDLDPELFPDGRMTVNGSAVARGIFQAFYNRGFYGDIPLMIEIMERRDPEILRAYITTLAPSFNHDYGYGMQAVANCRGAAPSTPEALAARREAEPVLSDALADGWWQRTCAALGITDPDPAVQTLQTEVPVLVFAGAWDPITPPSYAETIMPGLTNGILVTMPYTGHSAAAQPCGRDIYADFLAAPSTRPDTSCVSRIAPPQFAATIHDMKGPYRLVRAYMSGDYLQPALWLGASLALVIAGFIGFPAGATARLIDHTETKSSGGARILSWLAALLTLGGLATIAYAAYQTVVNHPLLLPAGVVPAGLWGSWVVVAGVAVAIVGAVITVLNYNRGVPIGTMIAIQATLLAVLSIAGFLFTFGLMPV